MSLIYGCECNHAGCSIHPGECSADTAPISFRVLRNDKELLVCSRCDLTTDKKIAVIPDESDSLKPFIDYDPMAIVLAGYIDGTLPLVR